MPAQAQAAEAAGLATVCTLPMGAMVRVTNAENGRTVTVRINDRVPTDESRIIDLSRAAADALGFRASGIAKVRLEGL